jgi:gliding motility-associated-like protein
MVFILKRYTLFYLLFFSFTFHALAQNTSHVCGTDEILNQQLKNKNQRNVHNEAEKKIFDFTKNKSLLRTTSNSTYVIPVVVHVIHNGGTENISDAQIIKGIQDLNEAFSNTGYYDTIIGTTVGIQFCLAKQDENGLFSTGITHTQSTLTDVLAPSQDAALKNLIRWNTGQYLNIWIVKEITSESAGTGVAGYAYFPSAHGSSIDGVVSEARYFGSSVDNSKIHIHEVGHYLGLYHTFEGGCPNGDCLTQGDRVCDTPPDQSTAVVPCANATNTCATDTDDNSSNNPFRSIPSGGLGDQHDMTSNYMDYGNDFCRVLFTPGQRDRMIAALTTTRSSLLDSKGCEDLCPNPIQIAFTPSDTTIVIGATINFINTTVGAVAYEWKINSIVFSTDMNPSYVFNTQGTFIITLRASNGISTCVKELTKTIKVRCTTLASFSGPNKIKPGQTVMYTNTSTTSSTCEWILNGTSVSTNQSYSHTFSTAGGFFLYMINTVGTCKDTSFTMYIQVAECLQSNEGNTWYFGAWAGLDFSGSTPVPIMFPLTFPSIYHFAGEGCVSMSTSNGDYLFFANAGYVFNKKHLQMPNGSGLLGDESATQMAAIANPGHAGKYYIFTVDAFGGPDGFRYSEIDMSLDGGLGDVITATKNTFILPHVTEKITTIKHSNGVDVWVLVHEYETDAFYAYQVTPAGPNAPVVSHIGSVHTKDQYDNNVIGQMKASPDGCKLALAVMTASYFEVFNFDAVTGTVSNPMLFSDPKYDDCYGVEFSPDGSKLYIGSASSDNIYQFDLQAGSAAAITQSSTLIGNGACLGELGSFQLGPYGKIYVARTAEKELGVINDPNTAGVACNFVKDQVYLGGRSSDHGLPAFDQSFYYSPKPEITGLDTVCTNTQNIRYSISNSTCAANTSVWKFAGKGALISSDNTKAIVDFKGEGIDTLIVERTSACGKTRDTFFVVVRNYIKLDLKDTVQCSANSILLDAGNNFTSYLWQDNSTSHTYTASGEGKYWVTVTSPDGCSLTDTVRVLSYNPKDVFLGKDTTLCAGNILVLNAGSHYTIFDWQDHSGEQTYTVFQSGKYWVTAKDYCRNTFTDTIEIFNCCKMNIPNLITPNNDGLNDTFAIACLDSESGWMLEISNSWGEIIYKDSNYKNNWGAKNISDGVYFYLLKKDSKKYKGWVQVMH